MPSAPDKTTAETMATAITCIGKVQQERHLLLYKLRACPAKVGRVLRPDTRQNRDLEQDDERKKSPLALVNWFSNRMGQGFSVMQLSNFAASWQPRLLSLL